MRLLISIRPFYGHLHPFVALAAAALARGHEVTVATAPAFCPVVSAAGLRVVGAGLHPHDPMPPGTTSGADYGAYPVRRKTADLVSIARDRRIDVILRDPTDLAATVAGEVLDIPYATMGFCLFIPGSSWDTLVGGELDVVRAEYGLPPDPTWERLHPHLYLDAVPWFYQSRKVASPVQFPVAPTVVTALRERAPAWLRDLPAGPVILVTLGTVYHRRPDLLRTLVEGAERVGGTVIVTVGPDLDPAEMLPDPSPRVRVERFVPLATVLPRCDAVVTAGGYNTVMAAIRYGVPLVVVPLGSDQPNNAERVATLGIGERLSATDLKSEQVTEALNRLLTQPSYRVRSSRLEELCAALPGPAAAVRRLQQLVDEHRATALAG